MAKTLGFCIKKIQKFDGRSSQTLALEWRLREDESINNYTEALMISLFETQKEYMARKSAEAEKRARKESTRIRLELASAALKRVEANHLASLKMARAY